MLTVSDGLKWPLLRELAHLDAHSGRGDGARRAASTKMLPAWPMWRSSNSIRRTSTSC